MKKPLQVATAIVLVLAMLAIISNTAFPRKFKHSATLCGSVSVSSIEMYQDRFHKDVIVTTFYDSHQARIWQVSIMKTSWDSLVRKSKVTDNRISVCGNLKIDGTGIDSLYIIQQ